MIPLRFGATFLPRLVVLALSLACAAPEKGMDRLLLAAAEAQPRPIEGRLSISGKYQPWPAVGEVTVADLPEEESAGTSRGRGEEQPSADLHRRALLSVFGANLPRARELLHRASTLESSLDLSNDQAAVDIALARERRPWLLADAVEAASATVDQDPSHREAAFNLALGLERLALIEDAKRAWRRYLALEDDEGWRGEVETRLARLEAPSEAKRWEGARPRALAAAQYGDLEDLSVLARQFPRPLRELLERDLLPAWGQSAGTSAERAALDAARRAAEAVAAEGEKLYLDAVDAIDRQSAAQVAGTLAAGHLALAGGLATRGDCSQAEPFFERAAADFAAGGSPMVFVARLELLICDYRRRTAQVAPAFAELATSLEGKGYPALRAKVEVMQGLCAVVAGRYTEAMRFYRQALARLGAGDAERMRVLGLLDEANRYAGDRQSAWGYRLQALVAAGSSGDFRLRHSILMGMAEELAGSGRARLAGHVLDEMLANARAWGEPGVEAEILLRTIPLEIQRGRGGLVKQEIAACELALERFRQPADRDRLAAELEIVKAEHALATRPTEAATLASSALHRLAVIRYGVLDARALLTLGRARVALRDLDGAAEAFERALITFEERRAGTDDERRRITYFATAQDGFDAMIRLQAIERRDVRQAFAFVERMRARGLRDHWRSSGTMPARDEPLERRLDRIPAEAVVVAYAVLPERLLIFRLERNAIAMSSVEHGRHELSDLVAELRSAFRRGRRDEVEAIAGQAYGWLLASALEGVAPERELYVLPDRELHGVPFAALYDPARGRFVVENHAVTILASLEALEERAEGFSLSKGARALVVGDPAFDRAIFPGLARLPAAAEEASAVTALYQAADALKAEEATRQRILAGLPGSEVFHLAAHVQLDPFEPLGALVATAAGDTVLRASDFDREQLASMRLAFLAACDAAPGFPEGDREGVAGLTRAFQAAGVPSIVATLWGIEDRGAARLGPLFHARLAAGQPPAAALRGAQLDLHHDPSPGTVSFVWTPFQLYRATSHRGKS